MPKPKYYQALYKDRIFVSGAAGVKSMINDEKCDVMVDLRAEATKRVYPAAHVHWIHIPLQNHPQDPDQKGLIQQAIEKVVSAYKSNHKVGFHCAAGRGRAGTVAVGVLLKLKLFHTVDEAERAAKAIRKKIQLNPAQKKALYQLFPSQ